MENLIVIKSQNRLSEVIEYIKSNDLLSFDTETTGVDKESKIIGFSVSADVNTAYYVAIRYWDAENEILVELDTLPHARSIIELLIGKNLIMHNSVFDCSVVESNFKIDLMPHVHTDTLILAHLLDENRLNGLKELGVSIFGQDAAKEQHEMKDSVTKNGGKLTKDTYELYKADVDLIGKYGAKDTLLTIKLFYLLVEKLYEEGLDKFFYEDECMPLVRGPTYDLNKAGLRVDADKLGILKSTLEAECMSIRAFIDNEVTPLVEERFPGTNKSNRFNIRAPKQLSWLLFIKLQNPFDLLTKEGRNLCKILNIKLPYTYKAKRDFIAVVESKKGEIYQESVFNRRTKKMVRPKKIGNVWDYLAADKATLKKYADKYKWVESLLVYAKNMKLLSTYVEGIQTRMRYNIIRPSFLQHGTTSGRYSSRSPNFQNLPRDDKRIKGCIISRPGKVFVGADYSQLEPRIFASLSDDERLIACFKENIDFYSVVGTEVFDKKICSLDKESEDSFAKKFPELRQIAKVVALSAAYGTTAPKMAPLVDKSLQEASEIITNYFESFPKVKTFMLESHEQAKRDGYVLNLYGRPRRLPEAKKIDSIFGTADHASLPYDVRNILNLSVNHRVQSTGASIINRAMIKFHKDVKSLNISECYIVMTIHDEIIVECLEKDANIVSELLKNAMENTVTLPKVGLEAKPVIGRNLKDLK